MFSLEKYYSLLEDQDCRTPYQPVAQGTRKPLYRIDGQPFIERPSRYDLSDVSEEYRKAVVGKSVVLGYGKSVGYELIFWVSTHDLVFFKAVEELRSRFMEAHLPIESCQNTTISSQRSSQQASLP